MGMQDHYGESLMATQKIFPELVLAGGALVAEGEKSNEPEETGGLVIQMAQKRIQS